MIAIDFGTTNSSIATFTEGDSEPRLQQVEYADPDGLNANVMPSAVCICKTHECHSQANKAGNDAVRHYFGTNHDISFLQEMKLHFDVTTKRQPTLVETSEYTILREEDGSFLTPTRKVVKQAIYEGDVPLEPKDFVPGTAILIQDLMTRANVLKEARREAVFGVPASFKDAGKKRLRNAARLAIAGESGNFEHIHIYPEPLAAARAYMHVHKGNILVLDYGGGTLDISVLQIEKELRFDASKVTFGGFSEGGSRMDQMLLDYALDKADPSGKHLKKWHEAQNILVKRRIKRNVEKAKIQLSTTSETTIDFPGASVDPVRINRADLALALQGIMARMTATVTDIVINAVGKIDNITFVVLSGGSSLTSSVQNTIENIFRHLPRSQFVVPDASKPEDVQTCLCAVAKGLAWLRKDGFPPIDFGD